LLKEGIEMCGRYEINIEDIEIRQIIDEAVKNIGEEVRVGEIFPTNKAPILVFENGEIKTTIMDWGFPNFKNKGVIINARAETTLEKRTFREAVINRRCIIPSTGFYEWNKNKEKFLFKNPKSNILYMAGLYSVYENVKKFVILTTSANESMRLVHERMPVVLNRDSIIEWSNAETATYLLQKTPPNLISKKL